MTNYERRVTFVILAGYCLLCGILVCESGLFEKGPAGSGCIVLQQANPASADEPPEMAGTGGENSAGGEISGFTADNAPPKNLKLGSTDRQSGFKFEVELTSQGASIVRAVLSEFDDRNYENPQPLAVLSPVQISDSQRIMSMANKQFVFVDEKLQLSLDKLYWEDFGVEQGADGSQAAKFAAVIKTSSDEPVIKLKKSFRITPGSYQLDCNLVVENLSDKARQVRFNLTGPVGIGREDTRADMRKVVGGFMAANNIVVSTVRVIQTPMFGRKVGLKNAAQGYVEAQRRKDIAGIKQAGDFLQIGRYLPDKYKPAGFLWAAATNKYFAAILRPVPDGDKNFCDWVTDKAGWYYNPDGDKPGDSGDETVGINIGVAPVKLSAAGEQESIKQYGFQLYLGPKDRHIFSSNTLYKSLGFEQAIDFMPCCCCPATIIRPLAFFILGLMRWLYVFIPNYGVVIMILVFVIRLVIHPLTRSSQVSMNRMSKLAPQVEVIKKKYENNKAEMNKQIMALYREQGASPILGMLPMFVQMPVWIALYSAIYASIELRGAPFLPVWITDLSAPDALFRFATITLPIFGKLNSFNLLPILMGVAFYLQQKMMPSQASSNPQIEQQQKMMKIMFPLLFPLMLYKAPSGLNLYIMSSSFAGVVEQYFIKKHIREKEEIESQGTVSVTKKTGGKVKKKKPKPFYRNF